MLETAAGRPDLAGGARGHHLQFIVVNNHDAGVTRRLGVQSLKLPLHSLQTLRRIESPGQFCYLLFDLGVVHLPA